MQHKRESYFFNKKIKLTTGITVLGMGHWMRGFEITNVLTTKVVIPFISCIDLEEYEEVQNYFYIKFSIYPLGLIKYEVLIDPFNNFFIYRDKTYSTENFFEIITEKI